MEAVPQVAALVHLHGVGGLRLTPAHEPLSSNYWIVAFEMPGVGPDYSGTLSESPRRTNTHVSARRSTTSLIGCA
jgi:hypothetical protein